MHELALRLLSIYVLACSAHNLPHFCRYGCYVTWTLDHKLRNNWKNLGHSVVRDIPPFHEQATPIFLVRSDSIYMTLGSTGVLVQLTRPFSMHKEALKAKVCLHFC